VAKTDTMVVSYDYINEITTELPSIIRTNLLKLENENLLVKDCPIWVLMISFAISIFSKSSEFKKKQIFFAFKY
jgi:hypothetical protein